MKSIVTRVNEFMYLQAIGEFITFANVSKATDITVNSLTTYLVGTPTTRLAPYVVVGRRDGTLGLVKVYR